MDDVGRRGPHDMGGRSAGPIDTTDHGMEFWERHANALRRTVVSNGIARVDELRRVTEDLGEHYYELAYFEKAAVAMRNVLIEKGIIDGSELDARIDEMRARYAAASEAAIEPDTDR